MIGITSLVKLIQQKSRTAVQDLKGVLLEEVRPSGVAPKSNYDKYLNAGVNTAKDSQKRNGNLSVRKVRAQSKMTAGSISGVKIAPNNHQSSKSITPIVAQELQKKRERLMSELKSIDLEMKHKSQEVYLEKSKKLKTDNEDVAKNYERAAKLIEKMNQQRRQMEHKKQKQFLSVKKNVEESLQKFKQMERQKVEEQAKKKIEIQKRIEKRKVNALERQRLNRASNSIIKEINSYKVSLPDICLKPSVIENPIRDESGVMLTNVEDNNSKLSKSRQKESKATSFLSYIKRQQDERKKQASRVKEYHKQIREKQHSYGEKLRLNNKQKRQKEKERRSPKAQSKSPPSNDSQVMAVEQDEREEA